VAELNEVIDAMVEREMDSEQTSHRWAHLLARSPAFRHLIDNPPVLPILEELLGAEFRLDHEYVDVIRSGMGPIGAGLHGGAIPFRPIEYYWSGDGQMHSGLVSVAYNLKDVGPDDWGFACVPGSHKSGFAFPDRWKDLTDPHPCVRRVTGAAGSAIIFTEALVHGTLLWQGAEDRRTAFYKYSPRTLAWSRTSTTQPTIRTSPPGRATSSGLRVWSTWKIDPRYLCAPDHMCRREVAGRKRDLPCRASAAKHP
jgi:hypothetical protein